MWTEHKFNWWEHNSYFYCTEQNIHVAPDKTILSNKSIMKDYSPLFMTFENVHYSYWSYLHEICKGIIQFSFRTLAKNSYTLVKTNPKAWMKWQLRRIGYPRYQVPFFNRPLRLGEILVRSTTYNEKWEILEGGWVLGNVFLLGHLNSNMYLVVRIQTVMYLILDAEHT